MQGSLPDPKTHKFYFDYGTRTIDKAYETYQLQADKLLLAKGYVQGENWITQKFEGHEHSEKDWRKRIHVPLEFLLRNYKESLWHWKFLSVCPTLRIHLSATYLCAKFREKGASPGSKEHPAGNRELAECCPDAGGARFRRTFPWHAYAKWHGAFWTLLQLVDLGYPPGNESLLPLMEQNYAWLLDADRFKTYP